MKDWDKEPLSPKGELRLNKLYQMIILESYKYKYSENANHFANLANPLTTGQ